ncbi:hypothetical protein NEOLEDRAFT_1174772 [Neolentinus lepideus HHB14362 ss-1]|uniref:Uncharacterized protein n=1 Tax=Neolentinus lepideus HHB14362 ss-1 TaxID=1314782 RepID=A0A165VJJ5_9AGAM|nr:hypothetical protein NEOLEDRAFT_1174772 [Neolentinus lepideus HHB14362 ss-1]
MVMLRRVEPIYPSFSLVINEMLEDPFHLPVYQSYCRDYAHEPCPRPTNPLLTTADYRNEAEPQDFSTVPDLSWSDFWAPDEAAANLQAVLENRRTAKGSISRRRRFADLVIDLAHTVQRKSNSLLRMKRKTNMVKTAAPRKDLTS